MVRLNLPNIGPVFVRPKDSDLDTLRMVFGAREYEIDYPPELVARVDARYREMIGEKRRPIIVDAGANIGAASLWFGRQFPEARIAAVEPDGGNLSILKKNLEGRANCVVVEAAIGAERGFADLTAGVPGWAVQTSRSDEGVPILTMADCLAASGGDAPFLVKIDIEGFEADLFSSNLDWLDQVYVVMIEPHDWMLPGQGSSLNFQRALAARSFELFIKGENLIYVRA